MPYVTWHFGVISIDPQAICLGCTIITVDNNGVITVGQQKFFQANWVNILWLIFIWQTKCIYVYLYIIWMLNILLILHPGLGFDWLSKNTRITFAINKYLEGGLAHNTSTHPSHSIIKHFIRWIQEQPSTNNKSLFFLYLIVWIWTIYIW